MKDKTYYIHYYVGGKSCGTGPYKSDVVFSLFNKIVDMPGFYDVKLVCWGDDDWTYEPINTDFEAYGNQYIIGKEYYTDYPFTCLGDIPNQKAPVRKVKLLSYDGDKYCLCSFGLWVDSFKLGYLYDKPQRMNSDFDGPRYIDEPIEKVLTPDE